MCEASPIPEEASLTVSQSAASFTCEGYGMRISGKYTDLALSWIRDSTMKMARMAQEVGLFRLPDDLLARIAFDSRCEENKWRYSDWARATETCKRLRDVQLPDLIVFHNWKSEASLLSHRLLQPVYNTCAEANAIVEQRWS